MGRMHFVIINRLGKAEKNQLFIKVSFTQQSDLVGDVLNAAFNT